jgi:hypothetical protein
MADTPMTIPREHRFDADTTHQQIIRAAFMQPYQRELQMLSKNDGPSVGEVVNASAVQLMEGDDFTCQYCQHCQQEETPINVNEAVCYLHAIISYHLIGPGDWPADEEPRLELLEIIENLHESLGVWEITALGRKIPLDLMMVFAGCWEFNEIPIILANYDCIAWDEAEALEDFHGAEYELEVHAVVSRAYLDFCRNSKWEVHQ